MSNPHPDLPPLPVVEAALRVATDRVAHWAGLGAQLSPTVARLVEQAKKAAV